MSSVTTLAGASWAEFSAAQNLPVSPVGRGTGKQVDVTAAPWRADPTGSRSATLAIEAAAASLQDGDVLWAPASSAFLIDHPWEAFSDSDPVDLPGRGRAVVSIIRKRAITIDFNGSTVRTVNHPIDAKGGLLFAFFKNAPDCRVTGIHFDMSFTGWNTLARRYPLCGGVMAFDKYGGATPSSTLCSGFEADHLSFKLFHPQGAFSVTNAPHGVDNNNGHKILSVFASGDSAAASEDTQNRGLYLHDITFLDGHNGYGCWGVAYSDARFQQITAKACTGAYYHQPSAKMAGANFLGPVRYYQYRCKGLEIVGILARSIPYAQRTGAFMGLCGAVHVHSGLPDNTGGGAVIRNIQAILDGETTQLGPSFDVGVSSTLSGIVGIEDVRIDCHTQSAAVGLLLVGNDGSAQSHYRVVQIQGSQRLNGPLIEVLNGSNVSDARRTIKSLYIDRPRALGFGSAGSIFMQSAGKTFFGVEKVTITGGEFSGEKSMLPGHAINFQGRTDGDTLEVTDCVVKSPVKPISAGSARLVERGNEHNNGSGGER